MKILYLFIFTFIVHASPAQQLNDRHTEFFNFDWKFHMGDTLGAEKVTFADQSWRKLDVPHDYSIEGSFDQNLPSCNGYLPGGIGWYRKSFSVSASGKDRKVFVRFDGVYKNSEVWINGHYLGKRPSGYIAFEYDLTPWIRFGKENIIAVKSDHTDLTDSGWYTGSGIFRNVHLIYTHPVHIRKWGVFAATSKVTATNASMEIAVDVINETKIPADAIVQVSLVDKAGKEVAKSTVKNVVQPEKENKFNLLLDIKNPQLWCVESPYLYTLRTVVMLNNRVIDSETILTGIREIRFDADKGVFLNGKNIKLKGVCLVHDAGVLGSAVPGEVWEGRLNTLKLLGCNAIRACHNPHASEFLDLCDKLGFLVIDEAYDEWEQPKTKWIDGWNQSKKVKNGYYRYFPEWGKQDLSDQVMRDRNHPSVMMWSIGNEIDFPNDPYSHPSLDSSANPQTFAKYMPENPDASRLKDIAHELVKILKESDMTRPVTAGLASAYMSTQVGFASELDVTGYNYQEKLYAESHKKYPKQVLYGSETGHRYEYWKAVADNDYISSQFLWTGFEYLGESFKWPQRTNPFGIIDLGGSFKPEAYFRQSLWSDKPMAYIGAWDTTMVEPTLFYLWDHKNALPHWNWGKGKVLKISGFTNCEEMELFLNGKSLGTKKMIDFADHVITWYVPFEQGVLTAVARIKGAELAKYELATFGKPFKISAVSDLQHLKADRRDVARIVVNVTDTKNVSHYLAENRIYVETQGNIRVLGIENSNPADTEHYKKNEHQAYHGRVVVYIQSLDKPGKAWVKLTSQGLQPATVNLDIVK
ncbi:sugar-binding domain-containing protein [Dyadobacter sp. NIV53]|uniref:sugar-binding domain-containing protein n=1 Tax=Dyadobacter sp. NIV53 TaxID=2861765 RepID=UPI001C86850B|nr:sugar-binding domain-containing protein [Dyadobacter sp. NIV53]